MSTTTEVEVVAEPTLTLDDLTYFPVGDTGLYCFVGLQKDICEKVESLGFQIYYIMVWEKFYKQNSTSTSGVSYSTQPSYRPGFFKVVNNFVSRTITDAVDIPLDSVEPSYEFCLPKIPYDIIGKLDKLFRAVDKQQKTESIVILTYDTAYEGSDGWGFVVPDQENTSTFCDYKPETIVDQLPETAYIVGSIHSHPNMPAYASGTDHKDQATFDGIHITYGWKGSGPTEYHAEIQAHGTNLVVPIEDIIESAPEVELPEDELDTYLTNISKKTHTTHVVGKAMGGVGSSGYGTGYSGYNRNSYAPKTTEHHRIKNYPSSGPSLTENVVIGVISERETFCPFCNSKFIDHDITRRRCMTCHQYFAYQGESVNDLIKLRNEQNIFTFDINVDAGTVTQDIYLWHHGSDGDVYEEIHSATAGK